MRLGTVVLVTRAFAVGIFVTCGTLQCALGAEERVNVDQGWSDKQKGTWYTTSQGSVYDVARLAAHSVIVDSSTGATRAPLGRDGSTFSRSGPHKKVWLPAVRLRQAGKFAHRICNRQAGRPPIFGDH